MGCSVLILSFDKGKNTLREGVARQAQGSQKDTSHKGEAVHKLPYTEHHHRLTLPSGGQDI